MLMTYYSGSRTAVLTLPHQILGTNISNIVHSANIRCNSSISTTSRLDRVKFLTGRFNRQLLDNLTRANLINCPFSFNRFSTNVPLLYPLKTSENRKMFG